MAVCLAVGLYAGVVADAFPASEERRVEGATLDRVYQDVATDGTIRASDDGVADALRTALARVDDAVVPAGYAVSISLSTASGGSTVRESIAIDSSGSPVTTVPERARAESRPVAIGHGPGDVRGGRLRIEVWRL